MCSKEYDECLDKICHYKIYPVMKPWIGKEFSKSELKILIIAESHYLPKGISYHHNVGKWYKGIVLRGKISGITTRTVIKDYYIDKNTPRAYRIFINIGEALIDSCLPTGSKNRYTVYENIAFMNFFQRPAETNGASIKVNSLDKTIANKVAKKVVDCIKPDIVIFTSVKAYKNAKSFRIFLDKNKIPFERTPHPATPWWNMKVKKYGNKTGRERFIDFICEYIKTRHKAV